MTLPEGFSAAEQRNPSPGHKTFAYVSEVRADNSRGIIQISLMDFKRGGVAGITLDEFAQKMISGIRRPYADWKETQTLVTLDGVPAKRIAWSGTMQPPGGSGPERVGVAAVTILAIKDEIGISLQALDRETRSSGLRPIESAFMTFALSRRVRF